MAIVGSFLAQLQAFEPLFTASSFRTFQVLACGWVLALGRHTVTTAVRSANAAQWKHIRSFHRFFSRARWGLDQLGLVLARRIDGRLPKDLPLVLVLDDTLGRRTGKKVAYASMHRDPLLSTRVRHIFSWGHLWVVLGITVRMFDKTFCLPVLFRLYRSEKVCARNKCAYRTMPELGADLIALLAKALSHRALILVGDGAYSNQALVKHRPANVTVVGRSRLDAAIYAPPPPRQPGQMGRPRVRGVKLPAPGLQANAKGAAWQSLEVFVYGRTVAVKALVIDALWYSVSGGQQMRLVVVRDFPGHERDDVLFSTDVSLPVTDVIELYAKRWSIEVTFQETKGKLGLEQPRCRAERAVERTAPFTLLLYTLVVLWYAKTGCTLRSAQPPKAPWYSPRSRPAKTQPAFSDMLATLRRASWAERLSTSAAKTTMSKKPFTPLLACL
ncbi:IS701 family transposase, partial [Chondromyces apiculatus]|uniref:IS701 family transposase n=1 Tax=Chondromyces apiculatus TaxID=51 RepID=UPI00069425BB